MPNSATVLILEDDLAILNGIRDLLNYADIGYDLSIITATNGRNGLQYMQQQTPDLILSDIMMPHMDGFEFLETIRRNPEWVHIPLIFLTAKGKEEDIIKGRLSGAELYITKPFNSEHLLQYVDSQLSRSFARRAVHEQDLAQLKRSILQMLSHEFKTPLTYVTAYYEILAESLKDFNDDEHLQTYLRGIQTGCLRLSRLIEDLILIITLRTGEAKASFERNARPIANIGQMLRDVGAAYAGLAARSQISIAYDIAADLPPVFGEADQIHEALDRLVDNAVKFTMRKQIMEANAVPGQVTLRAGARDGAVVLTIADTGVGFPQHLHQKIFGFMFQHNRELMEQQGSGSGLSIAKGIVEVHGGEIVARGEEGVGATFEVWLPQYNRTTGARATHQQMKNATILVVEDDIFLLNGLREILELHDVEYQFKVITATNGLEGLEQLEKSVPDIIVSDIMMPQMDGMQFLAAVRDHANWLHIPFIFLTAKGEAVDIRKGRTSGAEEYITKPYDSDQLIDLIITRLNRHFQVEDVRSQDFELLKRDILDLLQPDFREPISAVNAYSLEMADALTTARTDEDLRQSLSGIKSSSQQLVRLVEDFIILAELKTGEARETFNLRASPKANINAFLLEVLQNERVKLAQANLSVKDNLAMPLPPVVIDSELLSTMFSRLLYVVSHLCQESDGRDISLTAAVKDTTIQIKMAATGKGLAQAQAALISEFCATGSGVDQLLPEIGPQLAIAHDVAVLHNGQLDFSLQTDPAGFCFGLHFPMYAG